MASIVAIVSCPQRQQTGEVVAGDQVRGVIAARAAVSPANSWLATWPIKPDYATFGTGGGCLLDDVHAACHIFLQL